MAGMKEQGQRHISLAWRAAIWVTLIAILAVTGLYFLQRWHRRAAHEAATETVAERGQWLTMSLALRAAEMAETGRWLEFSGLLKSLREVSISFRLSRLIREMMVLTVDSKVGVLPSSANPRLVLSFFEGTQASWPSGEIAM